MSKNLSAFGRTENQFFCFFYSLSTYAVNTVLVYFRNWNNGTSQPDNASGNQLRNTK